jgi:hypothetical protein
MEKPLQFICYIIIGEKSGLYQGSAPNLAPRSPREGVLTGTWVCKKPGSGQTIVKFTIILHDNEVKI